MSRQALTRAAYSPSSVLLLGLATASGPLGCPATGNAPCDVSSDAALEALGEIGDLQCDLVLHNTVFSNLDPLAGVRSTPYGVTVRQNLNLIDVESLAEIRVPAIYVNGNPQLPSVTFELDGFVNDFVVGENAGLTAVSAPNLSSAGMWAVRDGPVDSISAPALEDVGTMAITGTEIAEFNFPRLRRVSTIVIVDNAALPSAAIDQLFAQLEELPATIQRCGNLGDAACPESDEGELNP